MSKYPRAAALCAILWAAALPAAASHTIVQEVRIAVVDPRTSQELGVIAPDASFELPPNEERLLRVFEPPRPERQERRYLAAEFGFGAEQTPLELTRRSPSRGEAGVRVRASGGALPTGRWHVGYRIDDDVDLADESLRLGRVFAEVVPAGQSPQRADELVAALYRGILLREPDAAAAARRDDIRRSGYAGVLRQAREIATSHESEIDVYKRACNQQRLLALYKELLGRDSAQIDQRLWRSQLEHLDAGDVDEVVSELVQTREFQDRWTLQRRGRRGLGS
jgi:hypothetical protein